MIRFLIILLMALFLSFLFFSFLFFSYPFSDTWSEWKKKMKQILMLEVRRTGFRLVSSDAFLHSWHEVPAEPRGDKISRWLWSPIKTGWRFTLIFERHQKKKKKRPGTTPNRQPVYVLGDHFDSYDNYKSFSTSALRKLIQIQQCND